MREVAVVVLIPMIVASSATSAATTRTTAATVAEVATDVVRGRGPTIADVALPATRHVVRDRRTADAVARARGHHTEGRGRVTTKCQGVTCYEACLNSATSAFYTKVLISKNDCLRLYL